VRVAGTPGGERTLNAVAYRNLTRGVVDDGVGGTGCTRTLLWMAGCGLGTLVLLSLLGGESPSAALGEIVPGWVWIGMGVLLVLAILGDLRLSARRGDVMALLGGG
jgi:hypothetical protein